VPLTFATLTSLQGKDLAAGTGLFNLARQLGGSAGIAFLSTFLDHRTALHRANLVESVNVYSGAAMERLTALQNGFIAKGAAPDVAHRQALGVLDGIVQGQAAILSFEDAFLVIGVVFFCALPLLLLFKKGRPGGMARSGGH
jgi:MFS transporter, DHA2 family, multidrug resistance protein